MHLGRLLRFLIRWLGNLILLIGLLALMIEIVLWLRLSDLRQPLGQIWFDINPLGLNTTQAVVQRYLLPVLWDAVLQPLLAMPAWKSLTGIFFVCFLVGIFIRQATMPKRRYFY